MCRLAAVRRGPLVANAQCAVCMFGKDQLSSLGDQLQGSVMLRYNRRNIG